MEKSRLVLWSSFENYEIFRPQVLLEEAKGNIEIVAVIFLDEDVVSNIDGYSVIRVEELLQMSFDYVVGLENDILDDMQRILEMLKIPREKLLAGRIFNLPNFDFAKYIQVRKERVSIISDNCWGGFTYHSLGMPFFSPFINLFVQKEDVFRLMQNLPKYMEYPLEFVEYRYEKNRKVDYPVCRLGDVTIHCNHYDSYEEAVRIWNRRKSHINWENIFVKVLIETESELEEFEKIPYRKIGFSCVPTDRCDVIDFSNIVKTEYFQEKYKGRFWELVNWEARTDRVELKYYDVMKLLLGESDYRR